MEFERLASRKTLAKKEIVYFQDDYPDSIYFIRSGKIKISRLSPEGKELILEILGPGDIFGELAVTEQEKRGEIAEVLENAELCFLDVENLPAFLEKNPQFNLKITQLIGKRLKKIQSRVESLYFSNSTERIKTLIRNLAEDHGRKILGSEEVEIRLSLTHDDISKLTATSRQTVTGVMTFLAKENKILYDRRRILVRNPALL